MEIRQFRVVLRARDFDAHLRLLRRDAGAAAPAELGPRERPRRALPGRHRGDRGPRPRPRRRARPRRAFDYQGPDQKLEIVLIVASAERAYEEILFRDRNIPGGLRTETDGAIVFATHDPDGVHILFRG